MSVINNYLFSKDVDTLETYVDRLDKVMGNSSLGARRISLKSGSVSGTVSVSQVLNRFEELLNDPKASKELKARGLQRILELDAEASQTFAQQNGANRFLLKVKQFVCSFFGMSKQKRFRKLIKKVEVKGNEKDLMKVYLAARKVGKNENMDDILRYAKHVIRGEESDRSLEKLSQWVGEHGTVKQKRLLKAFADDLLPRIPVEEYQRSKIFKVYQIVLELSLNQHQGG